MDNQRLSLPLLNGAAAAALGGFVALLIALSQSPVVSSALSVLLAAAVLFLALTDKLPSSGSVEMSPEILARILGFSIGAIIALLLGLHLRASNMLGEDPLVTDYKALVEIGLDVSKAREMVSTAYQSSTTKANGRKLYDPINKSVLFSDALASSLCTNGNLQRTDLNAAIREHGQHWLLDMMEATNANKEGATYADLKATVRLACATYGRVQ